MIINLLLSMISILIIIIFLLSRYIRKLKSQNSVTSNFNELKQAYIETSHDIVFLKDENSKYVFVNKNFEKFNGIPSEQIIGYDDFQLLDEEEANEYNKVDLEVLNSKSITVVESESEGIVLRTTKFPVKLLNDSYGVGAYVEDVSEEYNSKRKLEESNQKLNKTNNLLSAILESSNDVIVFALDTNYCYLSFNSRHIEAMRHMFGVDIKIGMNLLEQISDDKYFKITKENFDRALTGESFKVIERLDQGMEHSPIWQNYYSPMYSGDGRVIGLTCFLLNITDRIKAEEKIAFLSYHDSLTGLYNRRFFQEEFNRLDVERNLPISIIIGDVNGLKLTNDIFGHEAGNLLLIKVAEVFRKVCRSDDIIARIGGDEFAILLPKTNEELTEKIVHRIKEEFSKERVKAIKGSISIGCDTKNSLEENILQTIENAENRMYSIKTLDRNNMGSTTIKTIIDTLHRNSHKQEEHSKNVSNYCEVIGKAMNLPLVEIRRLKEVGFLHDIGKVVLDENLLNKNVVPTEKELKEMKQHPVVGYRILNSFDDTLDLAEPTLSHHERWNGSGYPKGLKGEEIPKLARIIAVAEYYDTLTNKQNSNSISEEEAIKELQRQAGVRFDPEIVNIFTEAISNSVFNKRDYIKKVGC